MNVYQRLNEARDRFHGQQLKKSGQNKFAGYTYFELADFVVPALRIFKEVGLTSVISFGREEAMMQIINNEKPEEIIFIKTPMSEASLKGCHPVQNLGAVETYLRRYLWVAAMEIVEHDQLDAAQPADKPAEKTAEKTAQKVVAKRYEEPDKKGELFVQSLLEWADGAETLDELADLWKSNQKQIDEIKPNADLFKKLKDGFGVVKSKLSKEG